MPLKHTPGPWHLVMSDNATPFIQHEHGADWTDADDWTSRVCIMPPEITRDFNALANARLIAAAPDLLAALEMVVSELASGARLRQPVEQLLFKAIAKAKGVI